MKNLITLTIVLIAAYFIFKKVTTKPNQQVLVVPSGNTNLQSTYQWKPFEPKPGEDPRLSVAC